MPSIVIPNCVEVKVHWTIHGIVALNVVHATYTGASPIPTTVVESVWSSFKANANTTTWLGMLHNAVNMVQLGIRDLRTPFQPEVLSTSSGLPGTSVANPYPNQVAIAVTLKTAMVGRQNRGRVYLGGISQATDGGTGTITSAAMVDAQNFVIALQGALAGQSMTLAIGQKHLPARTDKAGNPLPERPANTVPVTQILTLNSRFDTQRRRLQ
jgi:hypothetical protein